MPAADVGVAVVTYARSRRTAMLPPTKTILEASEDVGVNIEYSCRVGTCGVCRTTLLSGAVTMEVEDGLEPGDKPNNIVLACQARATADVTVDA
jgi:ferredoxin